MFSIGDLIRARYLERFLPKGQGKLLDAGAGDGKYKPLVISKGYEYIGIDVKPRSPDVIYGDITDIPFPDNHFDKAICIDVIEEVEDDLKAVKELYRVLKPEGTLFLHTPKWPQQHYFGTPEDNPNHVRGGYSEGDLRALFSRSDFNIVKLVKTFQGFERLAWDLNHFMNYSRITVDEIAKLNPADFLSEHYGWLVVAIK